MNKILQTILKRKVMSGVVLSVIILGSYFTFRGGNTAETKYVLAAVEKGTIITSITGSGQVSVSNQVDIKPKTSGDVIYVAVKNGQEIRQGALVVQLDAHNAQNAVRDAEINLENAQISLAKLQLSQQSDSPKLQNSITNAQNNIIQAYQNGFNNVADTFLDLPSILTGIHGVLYDAVVGTSGQSNIGAYQNLMDQYSITELNGMINQATNDYLESSTKYNKNLDDYKTATRYSSPEQIINLINETLETAKTMSQTVKDEQNILDALVLSLKQYQSTRQIPSAITQYQSDIADHIGKLNGHITALANIQNSITSNQQTVESSQRALNDAKASNPLDIASQENSIKQKQAALQDARDALANYYIRAPFAGVVAKVDVKNGDSVSGGTAVATMITEQRIAEVSLNEIDVAKVKVGQKTTVTFDAVEGLTITGDVIDVDTIGTVSQGVVTYGIKIGFDTQDERIKPGMSVSAAIITDSKQDVLLVPNSAVKSSGGNSYVEMPGDSTTASQLLASAANSAGVSLTTGPQQQPVEVGLTNDLVSEVTNGLKEGDVVVVRIIIPSKTTTATTQSNSLFPTGGRTTGTGTGGGIRSGVQAR